MVVKENFASMFIMCKVLNVKLKLHNAYTLLVKCYNIPIFPLFC